MDHTREMPDSPEVAKQAVWRWAPSRLRAIRHGLILAGALLTAISLLAQIVRGWKADAWDYWATHLGTLAQQPPVDHRGGRDAGRAALLVAESHHTHCHPALECGKCRWALRLTRYHGRYAAAKITDCVSS